MSKNPVLISTAYLPPIAYYSKIIPASEVLIEQYEHFIKQSYRNRCYIYGPNGRLMLTIPLSKRIEKGLTKDIRICYNNNWQKIHWRSIESAYRCSPFFEYYEDDFVRFYQNQTPAFLIDFNEQLFQLINVLLKIKLVVKKTEKYEKIYESVDDYRNSISPNKEYENNDYSAKPYKQVFDNKYGFIPNLSSIDLLFNQGPSAMHYI